MFSDTVVILAAGKGSRMCADIPKVLMPINGEPVLGFVIDFWLKQGTQKFIFVVGQNCGEVIRFIKETHVDYKLACQPCQLGIANAILQVESLVKGRFVVALGDCLNIGSFEYPDCIKDMALGIWKDEYIDSMRKGYRAAVNWQGWVSMVEEKSVMSYSGMGTYFFDDRVFEYIRQAKPTLLRNEVEITNVIQTMISDGIAFQPVWFDGTPLNINTKQELAIAEKLVK